MLLLGGLLGPSVYGQRYLNEVFNTVTVTEEIEYSQNYTILAGTLSVDTLYMDVYEPAGDTVTERPLVLFLHSGFLLPRPFNGYPFGSKKDSALVELGNRMAKMGYVFAALDYRLGWNPIANDFEDINGSYVRAIYRGIQDVSAGVKYFKQNYNSQGNAFAIDTNKIVVGGFGDGGTIATSFNFLDDYAKLNTTRFFGPTTGTAYIDSTLLGRWDGAFNRLENMDNYPGVSASASMAWNMGGTVLDSLWIDANANPIVSLASPLSFIRPYDNGWIVIHGGGGVYVVELDGAGSIHENAAIHDVNALLAELDCDDTLSALADMRSNNAPGLFPFQLAQPASEVWNWWDTTDTYHIYGLSVHPNMSPALGRSYLDTIVGYSTPRMVKVLFEPQREQYFDGIRQKTTGLAYMALENGGGEMRVQAFDTECKDSLHMQLGFVTGFSLGMVSGGSCPNLADDFEVSFTGEDPLGQAVTGAIALQALPGSGSSEFTCAYSPVTGNGTARVEVLENGMLVTTQTLQASNGSFSIGELPAGACLGKVDFRARGQESGWELRLVQSANVTISGAGNFNGDEIHIYPSGTGVPAFVYMDGVDVLGTGLDDLAVDAEWVQKFNVWHEAQGETQYAFAKDSLTMDNIGMSGADGVTLKLPGELRTSTEFSPVAVDLPGSEFWIHSTGEIGGSPTFFGSIGMTGLSGGEGSVEADFSSLGSSSYSVALGTSPWQITGSESFPNGAPLVFQNAKRITRLETRLDTINGNLTYWIYFDGSVDAVLSALPVSGNLIRIRPDQPQNLPSAVTEIALLGQGLNGSFTIIGNDSLILDQEAEVEIQHSLVLYPNPAHDQLHLQQSHHQANRIEAVEVIEVLSGKILMRSTHRGQHNWKLDIATLPAGIYLLRAYAKEEAFVIKFVKQ